MYSFPTVLSQSARSGRILIQLFRDLAFVAPAVSLSNALRNSRLRFRLNSFFFRLRLNLALSPFLFDIYSPSRVMLRFRWRPKWRGRFPFKRTRFSALRA